MRDAFSTWLRWGVNIQPDWTLKRKIFHTNVAALVALTSLVTYCVALLVWLPSRITTKIVIAELPFYFLLAMIPWFNQKGRDNLARWTLAFSAVASQLISVLLAFGSYVNVHFYFILFAIVPVAFFPIRQWRAIVFLLVLNVSLYLTFELIDLPPDPEVMAWRQSTLEILRASYAASTVLTMFIFIWMSEVVAQNSEAKLENISLTDYLTNLPNRRYFESVFAQEIAKSKRDNTPLALAMVDIDHFKAINDNYGHDTGDSVLQHIAQLLSQATRKSNVIARIGGEEFAVLLPNTSLSGAVDVAERMRQVTQEESFGLKDQQLTITVSIGVVAVNSDLPMTQAYKWADEALYRAKNTGRNRVVASDAALPPEVAS